MKTINIIILLFVSGCTTVQLNKNQDKETPVCPAIAFEGTKWIPEAKTWIDWNEDFYSWHYHGRNREATKEEIEIHELEIQVEKTNNLQLAQDLIELQSKYEPVMSELKKKDKERFEQWIQEQVRK